MMTLKALLVLPILLLPTQSLAGQVDCLKPFPASAAYRACETDADCVLAGDACRTCGTLSFVNKRHKAAAEAEDIKSRLKDNCIRACEACDTRGAKGVCRQKVCKPGNPRTKRGANQHPTQKKLE